MSYLDSSYFQFGDLVTVSLPSPPRGLQAPGRVLCTIRRARKSLIRVAHSSPYESGILHLLRFYPKDMPNYHDFTADQVRLESHDPDWSPFEVKPPASAEFHRDTRIYLTGHHYRVGDPIWVWESEDWRPATVTAVGRWVSARYERGFKDQRGNRGKSYRTWQVWPVMSERSDALKEHFARLRPRTSA